MVVERKDHGDAWIHLLHCHRVRGAGNPPFTTKEVGVCYPALVNVDHCFGLLHYLEELDSPLLPEYKVGH